MIVNIVLLAAAAMLAVQNLSLKRRVAETVALKFRETEPVLGTRLPALEGYDLNYQRRTIGFDDPGIKATVVLVYSPACLICEDTWPTWHQLFATVDREVVRVIAVDMSSMTDARFAGRHQLAPESVLARPDARIWPAYRLFLVPRTMLIDSSGVLRGVWSGSLNSGDVAAVSRALRRLTG